MLGQERGTGDCSRAAAAEEARLGDAAVFEANCDLENIAADGIAYFDSGIGVREFAGIAGIAKVSQYGVAEHF